jgi:uncharacterized protein
MPGDVERAFAAVRSGDSAAISELLTDDRHLAAARNAQGISILLWACYHKQAALVEMLRAVGEPLDIFEASALNGGAEPGSTLLRAERWLAAEFSPDGFTPLHLAAYFGQEEMAGILLKHGADPNAVSRNAMALRPLHSASVSRALGIVTLLLDGGADVSVKQQGGWTPLHAAAFNGDLAMTELLVARGADAVAMSDDGKSPLDIATEKGHEAVADWLRSHAHG